MLNIEKYRDRLENYKTSLDCDIRRIRENPEEIKKRSCYSKSCFECRKENIEWLLSEAQILDDVEKKYLSAVIRPFKNKVKSILKLSIANEWIVIQMDDSYEIDLPKFKKGTMYQGMEGNRRYTLEELGL